MLPGIRPPNTDVEVASEVLVYSLKSKILTAMSFIVSPFCASRKAIARQDPATSLALRPYRKRPSSMALSERKVVLDARAEYPMRLAKSAM